MRDAWLDGLRALAALMVFVHHASPGTYIGGWDAGVLVFFSLSGYLLYRPFLEGPVDLQSYAIRRLLRIAPGYLVAVIGIAWLHGYSIDPVGVLTISRTPVIVAWTLQIEVVFYVALPALAWFAKGRRVELYLVACASLLAAAIHLRLTGLVPLDFMSWAWAFAPGMIVAHLAVQRPDVLAKAAHPLVPLAGTVLVALSVVPNISFPDIPAAIGAAMWLAWLLNLRPAGPRLSGVMVAAGALSYSFYLWHEALMGPDRPPSVPGALAVLLLTAAVSTAVYALVEAPAIRLGRRLTARRRSRVLASPSEPAQLTAVPVAVGRD
jgi:peptidoglycan/LPS O-acetylase OafA/YrhL